AAVNQPNPAIVQPAVNSPAPINPVPVEEDRVAVKRGRDDAKTDLESPSLAVNKEVEGVSNAEIKSPKNKRTKKENVASQGPGPVEKISPIGSSRKTFIPAETSHLPLSPSVDAAEFIDDNYSFNWEDEKFQNMGLEEATTLMLSHELHGVLMGQIVTHKAAEMAREVKARHAELDDANKKMKEAEDSACVFEGDLKKIRDFLKDDKAKRDKLEED
ncbi:hypothetical protein A2U01_0015903, partial [Trifolium medium]|nr:hypothetical protein [Trifolium medium]